MICRGRPHGTQSLSSSVSPFARHTKRSVTQKMLEWEEDNAEGKLEDENFEFDLEGFRPITSPQPAFDCRFFEGPGFLELHFLLPQPLQACGMNVVPFAALQASQMIAYPSMVSTRKIVAPIMAKLDLVLNCSAWALGSGQEPPLCQ